MAHSKKSNKEQFDREMAMILELQQQYNPIGITENAVFPDHRDKENYKPRTLVDQTLEIVDPTPNIHTLFMQFNARFFSNKLLSVEVKWSQRMTSCAGVCQFHSRSRDCIISLSAPLLKLRPRKDLVETLLHEMIHGYLFLTNNNRDRDGHGPEFCKHMNRINKEAGTNITIYHSFHDEVKLYQQHWWRCNGPCQKRPPYFGMVRRAMNRAPGPSDFWWKTHQQTCGGEYIKVKEPEKTKPQKKKGQKIEDDKKKLNDKLNKGKSDKNLDDWIKSPKGNSKQSESTNTSTKEGRFTPFSSISGNGDAVKKPSSSLVKLGTGVNNVHGWGTGGPGSSSSKSPKFSNNSNGFTKPAARLNFAGTVGGAGTGKSNLLDKFSSKITNSQKQPLKKPSSIVLNSPPTKKTKTSEPKTKDLMTPLMYCKCPICNMNVLINSLDHHLDKCTLNESTEETNTNSQSKTSGKWSVTASTPLKKQGSLDSFVSSPTISTESFVKCPVCDKSFEMTILNNHLDECLSMEYLVEPKNNEKKAAAVSKQTESFVAPSTSTSSSLSVIDLTEDKSASKKPIICLVCGIQLENDVTLVDHLEECVSSVFNDDLTLDMEEDSSKTKKEDSSIVTEDNKVLDDKFPCPICMEFISDDLMNEHLDNCLSRQK